MDCPEGSGHLNRGLADGWWARGGDRRLWVSHAAWFERYARSRRAAAAPRWGMSSVPVAVAGLQAGVPGVVAGSGPAAWARQRGWLAACWPVGVDVSAGGWPRAPLAGRVRAAFSAGSGRRRAGAGALGAAGLVISESVHRSGATLQLDPEAARLRAGGRLVFMAQDTLARMVPGAGSGDR